MCIWYVSDEELNFKISNIKKRNRNFSNASTIYRGLVNYILYLYGMSLIKSRTLRSPSSKKEIVIFQMLRPSTEDWSIIYCIYICLCDEESNFKISNIKKKIVIFQMLRPSTEDWSIIYCIYISLCDEESNFKISNIKKKIS